uniref:Uncharacterized protein n=1 Tax=Panagrolaimus sp. JU765 TaxID=591449 RepID=A0AC34R7F2_9BILA
MVDRNNIYGIVIFVFSILNLILALSALIEAGINYGDMKDVYNTLSVADVSNPLGLTYPLSDFAHSENADLEKCAP